MAQVTGGGASDGDHSGAKEDLRHVEDSYRKTAGQLAWEMQK